MRLRMLEVRAHRLFESRCEALPKSPTGSFHAGKNEVRANDFGAARHEEHGDDSSEGVARASLKARRLCLADYRTGAGGSGQQRLSPSRAYSDAGKELEAAYATILSADTVRHEDGSVGQVTYTCVGSDRATFVLLLRHTPRNGVHCTYR